MLKLSTLVVALCAYLHGPGASAHVAALHAAVVPTFLQHQQAPQETNLTGDWSLSLVGDHVMRSGLTLEQQGTRLTGTMLLMGKEAPVEGEFVEGAFSITAKAEMHDAHCNKSGLMTFVGKLQDDGTLAGEIAMGRSKMQWTAERMRKRK